MNRTTRDKLQALLCGEVPKVCVGPSAAPAESNLPTALFPGSFNPLHHGHRKIQQLAVERLKTQVHYEISVTNVDKPPLTASEIVSRVSQFSPDETIWITKAPTFVEKASLFPRACFLLGTDTIMRLVDPKYYSGLPQARDNAINSFVEQACRFLVFGRLVRNRFLELQDLDIPPPLRSICSGLSEREFRSDISSTTLRQNENSPDQARDR